MAEKTAKTKSKKKKDKKQKTSKSKAKKTKSKKTKNTDSAGDDAGIVVIDDDLYVDKDAVNEERRAYLEEARSQEAFD
jgi:hypothetical protein